MDSEEVVLLCSTWDGELLCAVRYCSVWTSWCGRGEMVGILVMAWIVMVQMVASGGEVVRTR